MNIFPLKRRLRIQTVADLLYEEVFCPLVADNILKLLPNGLVEIDLLNNERTNIKLKFECFSLIAFLVTFSFERRLQYLGQKKIHLILDCFHDKLFENIIESFKDDTFPDQLKARYTEYYPIMKEDLNLVGTKNTILFRGLTESFLSKVAPNKLWSFESLLFSFTLADLFLGLCKTHDKIKKYKIG